MIPRDAEGFVEPWYWDAAQRLATVVLQVWTWSNDPLGGPRWELFCDIVGIDPEVMLVRARSARRKPHFPCGHSKMTETTWVTKTGKEACRTCLSIGGRRGAEVKWNQ